MSRKSDGEIWREELASIRTEHKQKQDQEQAKLPQRLQELANYRKKVIRFGGAALFVLGGIGMIVPLILLNLTLASPIFIGFAIVASVGAFMAALPQVVQRILGEKAADTGIEMTPRTNTSYRAALSQDSEERQALVKAAAPAPGYGSGAVVTTNGNGLSHGGAPSAGPGLFSSRPVPPTSGASAARLAELAKDKAEREAAEAMRARIVARLGQSS